MFRFYTKQNPRVSVVAKHEDGHLKVAVAVCSTKDHFVKKTGRELAEKRLTNNQLYTEIKMPVVDVKKFVNFAKYVSAEVSKTKVCVQ